MGLAQAASERSFRGAHTRAASGTASSVADEPLAVVCVQMIIGALSGCVKSRQLQSNELTPTQA